MWCVPIVDGVECRSYMTVKEAREYCAKAQRNGCDEWQIFRYDPGKGLMWDTVDSWERI